MELELIRTYFPNGTNGEIRCNGVLVCFAIELPWRDNKPQVSCVAEGRYELVKRYSPKFKDHLQLVNVPKRDYILIHPANDAIKELRGCIAPVSLLTAEGKGLRSRIALGQLITLTYAAIDKQQQVFLTIQSVHDERNK
ncbi:MAG: hypothetical protein JST39_00080 [Bacteroidetes bacterium]|nr:hypothetical protein [Bacteroidota bacterium]